MIAVVIADIGAAWTGLFTGWSAADWPTKFDTAQTDYLKIFTDILIWEKNNLTIIEVLLINFTFA